MRRDMRPILRTRPHRKEVGATSEDATIGPAREATRMAPPANPQDRRGDGPNPVPRRASDPRGAFPPSDLGQWPSWQSPQIEDAKPKELTAMLKRFAKWLPIGIVAAGFALLGSPREARAVLVLEGTITVDALPSNTVFASDNNS